MANILIVDDAKFNRTLLNRGLSKAGHKIVEAVNGFEAEKILEIQHKSIDLVICDISMPEQDGIVTLEHIRKRFGDIPVVMLTAFSDKENVLKCAKLGISGFLVKPFDIKRVRSKIMEILGDTSSVSEKSDEKSNQDESTKNVSDDSSTDTPSDE
ncbi:MAG: two-component system response regulator [Candidatus Cloacimonadota bacterium]|nr:MAG: two-component system response regulator [Candidatus Cloacimonadota bacterium]